MMAHGIVAVSIITALMPRMSAAAADGRPADVAADLGRGIRLVAVVLAPITVVLRGAGRSARGRAVRARRVHRGATRSRPRG